MLQAAQRFVAGGGQRLAAGPAAVRIAGKQVRVELRGDDDAGATASVLRQRLADDRLGMSEGVAVGRVDEVPARSRNRARIASDSCTLEPQPHSSPNVIAPRQRGLTRSPECPNVT